MKIETDGLIIGEQSVGEKDRLVTVLTRKLGVIRAFVKNCKSLKSTKGQATRLLCYAQLSLYKRREAYIIDDAVSEKIFAHLRTDIVKM
ncbi:MAG: recombination protein O N-terminal domain-containing protein, partial [Clostridia bacterium]|nr:recombination protein O N-terminal domain-containing protein [Clostridia bacterium]